MMEWDELNNVWKGNKAGALSSIPDPLYIFGYGSLLWRPGDLLSKYQYFPCYCVGWSRLFAQRSMDHRGTSRFPGFVSTLVMDSFLVEVGMLPMVHEPSTCIGKVFLVPPQDIQELIAELDFREKGGYHRHILPVKFLESTPFHQKDETGNALVYTGSTDNPNFSYRIDGSEWLQKVASVISAAIGPSGSNPQYLLNLYTYVDRQQGVGDPYLATLAVSVCRKIGSWQGRLLLLESHLEEKTDSMVEERRVFGSVSLDLMGWGSNESAQLLQVSHTRHRVRSSSRGDILARAEEKAEGGALGRDDLLNVAERIVCTVDRCAALSCPLQEVLHRQVYAGGSRSGLQVGNTLFIWGDLDSHGCSFQSNSSGNVCVILPDAVCWLWRWDCNGRGAQSIATSLLSRHASTLTTSELAPFSRMCGGVDGAPEHGQQKSADTVGISCVLVVENVVCAAFGHNHTLVLLGSGEMLAMGCDDHGQCSGGGAQEMGIHLDGYEATQRTEGLDTLPPPITSTAGSTRMGVIKLAAGLQHSAAITSTGILLTWGDGGSSSASARILERPWLPPPCLPSPSDGLGSEAFNPPACDLHLPDEHCGVVPLVVDVSCGAKHTIVLDSVGRVFTFGDGRYGQLGRDLVDTHDHSGTGRQSHVCRTPTMVCWRDWAGSVAERDVRWMKVRNSHALDDILLSNINLY